MSTADGSKQQKSLGPQASHSGRAGGGAEPKGVLHAPQRTSPTPVLLHSVLRLP